MRKSIPLRALRAHRLAVAVLLTGLLVAPAYGEEPTGGGKSELSGTVVAPDGDQPVAGATVVLLELATGAVTRSTPTSAKGRFEIVGLGLGYYEISVETPDGVYVGSRIVDVAPSTKEKITVTLAPLDAAAAADATARLPAGAGSVGGEARVGERTTGRDFWKSPKGIAILAGGGTAILLWLATSGNSKETLASPL